ncbi:hypothetical protein [Tsukamurella soli]
MAALVAWVRDGNVAVVADGDDELQAHVVAASGRAYLRTFRGSTPTDHLLHLPNIAHGRVSGVRAG